MPSCAIVTCKHRSESINFHTNGITYHRFPSNPEVKQKWITATAKGPIWQPVKRSTICSVHFKENQFQHLPKSRRLFDWAVPLLKLPQIPQTLSTKHDLALEPDDKDMEISKKPSDALQPISAVATDTDTEIDSKTSTVTRERQNVIIPTKQASEHEESCSLLAVDAVTKNCKDMECVQPDDTLRKRKMRLQIERYKSVIQQKNRQIKTLQKKTSRYRKTMTDLKNILKELREKEIENSDHVMAQDGRSRCLSVRYIDVECIVEVQNRIKTDNSSSKEENDIS